MHMCAIYGSKNRTLFNVLHDATVSRGTYAFSATFINHKDKKIRIQRQQGHPSNIEKIENKKNDVMFLGHNQAPTSSAREYDSKTSHPFTAHNWIVAHNGVLTNHADINAKFCPWNKNVVDTSCIPNLFHALQTKFKIEDEVTIIADALDIIEGTFALWIVNETTGNVFIARQGSTLFVNPETGDFCSISSKGWIEVPEGKLFKITKTFEEVGEFNLKSPFFTL